MGIIVGMGESSTAPVSVSTGTMAAWFATPLGQHLLAREQAYFDTTLADIFGYHALQIGLPETPLLRASRIATRCTVDLEEPAQVLADPHWLPFRIGQHLRRLLEIDGAARSDAGGAQQRRLRQSDLQRVIAEDVGQRRVEIRLLA